MGDFMKRMSIASKPVMQGETEMSIKKHVGMGLGDLPLACIGAILVFTSPSDVARLACASRTFRDKAVWQTILPAQYEEIIAQAISWPSRSSSRMKIYNFLCSVRAILRNIGSTKPLEEFVEAWVCIVLERDGTHVLQAEFKRVESDSERWIQVVESCKIALSLLNESAGQAAVLSAARRVRPVVKSSHARQTTPGRDRLGLEAGELHF